MYGGCAEGSAGQRLIAAKVRRAHKGKGGQAWAGLPPRAHGGRRYDRLRLLHERHRNVAPPTRRDGYDLRVLVAFETQATPRSCCESATYGTSRSSGEPGEPASLNRSLLASVKVQSSQVRSGVLAPSPPHTN